ncbi:MAG: Ni/Fe hydrogenase subunit alpha [Anaerolineae bacterium]|nr:Ni/Fe hydrogenase subunit alpha [Anaerolineae bacterium]
MTENIRVNVHHVTRVEGHGNIVVDVRDGTIEKCELQIVETPRFFEAMLRGRPYNQASHITSRICGICAIGHATASLRATETALGVELSEQTRLLRKLAFHGEMLDSHILHTYMLVAPDFLNVGSVLPLAVSHPEVVQRALRMKKFSGDLCQVIVGRHTHPIAMTVGGFTHFPSRQELESLREQAEALLADVDATVELFGTLPWPTFERETEFVALVQDDEYGFIDGVIGSTDGPRVPISDYRTVTNERLSAHSTAKHAAFNRDSYMVGALARFNLKHEHLHPRAAAAADHFGLEPVCHKPYMNSAAQVVEIVHCVDDVIMLIDTLLERGVEPEAPAPVTLKPGARGVGSCDVPRGILFHEYQIDENGLIEEANCIIPTGQNLGNVDLDLRALVPTLLTETEDQITLKLEMLVRAYDPCISCSTHFLNVEFVGK